MNVVCSGQPGWKWGPDLYAHSRAVDPLDCDVLLSHREHVFHVQFKNEAGEVQRAGSEMVDEADSRM